MSTPILLPWALSLILSWTPLSRRSPWAELRDETEAQRLNRYQEIAAAAVAVAVDPSNPPLFAGDEARARARTVALLLSVAYHESALYNRVTTGAAPAELRPSTAGPGRSDSGRSWCALQILIGRSGAIRPQSYLARHVPEGWTGRDLEADPRKCFEVGYRLLRTSLAHCSRAPLKLRLGAYTGEGCGHAPKSATRMTRALAAALPRQAAAPELGWPVASFLASDDR